MPDLGGSFRYGFDEVHHSMPLQDAVALTGLLRMEGSDASDRLADRITTHLADRLEDEFELSHDELRLLMHVLRDADLAPGTALYLFRGMLAPHFGKETT
jgi:hypothetical protein